MLTSRLARGAILAAWALASCSPRVVAQSAPSQRIETTGATSAPATPLGDLGTFHRAITTSSQKAQSSFDQGMRLLWALNLEEAQRSFEEAAKLDSSCAGCCWGAALSLGPSIDLRALPERTRAAHRWIAQALAVRSGASPVEQALIEALARRYADPPPTDRAGQTTLDQAYADAMREVAKRFPDDDDVQALYVEALMDLRPHDYWTRDGAPQPGSLEIVSTLEKILKRQPKHPGANHDYILALEASPHPEKALAAAERLAGLMPGSGHMVHMPSHIYQRLGRYEEAAALDLRAVEADRHTIANTNPRGFFLAYSAHDFHCLSSTALMRGRAAEAIATAREAAAQVPVDLLKSRPELGGLDFLHADLILSQARFSLWDDVLEVPYPGEGFPYVLGIWRYARGLALAGKSQLADAEVELDSLRAVAAATPPDAMEDVNSARALLGIALESLTGMMAFRRGKVDEAVSHLEQAVRGEDSLSFAIPSDWVNPVRHLLGAVLLQSERPAPAEAVFREDLKRHPENGWALYGLYESLRQQGKQAEAEKTLQRFRRAWAGADVTSSVMRF